MKNIVVIVLCFAALFANAKTEGNIEMYHLLVKFTVKTESAEKFKQAALKSVRESRKEAGNIEMKFYADNNKNNEFYVYSRWDNKAAYEFHKSLPHSVNIAKVAKATLLAPPEIMPLDVTNPAPIHGLKQVNVDDQETSLFFIFKIKEAYREQVIKRFETHVKHSRTEEGNLLFDFYTIDGDENTFVVYENWRSKSALFDIHLKTPYSEVTGALLGEAMIGEMNQYMNFITEIEPSTSSAVKTNWEATGFAMPESVVADPNSDCIYVSNIVNRETPGYISRVLKSGKVDNYKWIEGLNQPCGLDIYDNKLYVGDQNKVHIIDIPKGKLLKSLNAEGAMTLNDVAIGKDGQVFISDVMSGRIYTIKNEKLVVWLENAAFTHPNGLYVDNGNLIVADLGDKLNPDASPQIPGSVYKVDMNDKSVELINPSYQIGGLDGVVKVGDKYIVTNNSGGELYAVTGKERILLASFTRGIADLGAEGQTIYIPNFAGTVTSLTLNN